MIQDAETSRKNRLTRNLFMGFVALIWLCSLGMRTMDGWVASYEQIGIGILGRLLSLVVITSWSITMIVLTTRQWKSLNAVARILGLSPLVFAPIFFILTFQ